MNGITKSEKQNSFVSILEFELFDTLLPVEESTLYDPWGSHAACTHSCKPQSSFPSFSLDFDDEKFISFKVQRPSATRFVRN